MTKTEEQANEMPATKRKLVEAMIRIVLERGFASAGVEQICAEAGVTKGAFFHYFKSKEDAGRAALVAWGALGMSIYSPVRNDPSQDPLEQMDALFDVMIGLAERGGDPLCCMVGMTAQETARMSSGLREACDAQFVAWVELVGGILADAKRVHPPRVDFDPEEVAWLLHSVWQGSMLIAKTRPDSTVIVRNLQHAQAYMKALFSGRLSTPSCKVEPISPADC
jgi:TetR/AcrR family transcriptional repressor of nem operon